MNDDWSLSRQGYAPAYNPSDSTDGHARSTPVESTSWGHDGYSHDPGFLASQEELRCLLFTIAQSAAPTRVPSPEIGHVIESLPDNGQMQMRPALSNAQRVAYLKNYVGEVAPWVSDSFMDLLVVHISKDSVLMIS